MCGVVRLRSNKFSSVASLSVHARYRMRPSLNAIQMDCKSHDHRSRFSTRKNESSTSTKTDSTEKQLDMSNQYIVSRNGIVLTWKEIYQQYPLDNDRHPDVNSPMEASALLQRLPRGAYTTCRTVKNGTHIYQFDYHMKRLAMSSASILETISEEDGCGQTETAEKHETKKVQNQEEDFLAVSSHPMQHHRNPSKLEIQRMNIIKEGWEREMALSCIRSSLNAYRCMHSGDDATDTSGNEKPDKEFRITLLATWEQNHEDNNFKSSLYCHIGLLTNKLSTQNTRVLIHGHGRKNASTKDSKWISERKQLIASNGYEEIILINDKAELLEGTQTNFYLVKDSNTIVTANEGVLFGSVRDSVLRVCKNNGIFVELRPPTLEDLKCASGVFITSTSRWVMPVHEIDLGDLLTVNSYSNGNNGEENIEVDSALFTYQYRNCPTTERIQRWVLKDVETHSTMI